jgi:hypothetical protein
MTSLPERPNKVSILARISPAFSCWIVTVGAAINAGLIMGVINAMRNAETAGIGAVATGIGEANLPTVVSLDLAIFVMAIGVLVMIIRAVTNTTTASPSAWFFAILALLGFVPLGLASEANSLLIQTLMDRGNVSIVAATIQLFLRLTVVTAALFSLVLLTAMVGPLPSFLRARRSWTPIVVLVVIEVALIGLGIRFQMHMTWLQGVRLRESF